MICVRKDIDLYFAALMHFSIFNSHLGVCGKPGLDFFVPQLVKDLLVMRRPLGKGTGSSTPTLAWRIPWTIKSQKVGHD